MEVAILPVGNLYRSLAMDAWGLAKTSYLMSTHVKRKYQSDKAWEAANATDRHLESSGALVERQVQGEAGFLSSPTSTIII